MPQLGVFPVIPAGTAQLRPYRSDLQLRQEEHPRPQRTDPRSRAHPSERHVTPLLAEPSPTPRHKHPICPRHKYTLCPWRNLSTGLSWNPQPKSTISPRRKRALRPSNLATPLKSKQRPPYSGRKPPFPTSHGPGGGNPPFQPAEQAVAAPPEHASPPPEQPSPRPASVERRSPERPSHNNYVENPRVTFLLEDALITCEICHESELTLTRPHASIRDETPAILPCGHVFGLKCINEWLRAHSTCPTCRLELRHKKCGHPVKAGPIHTLNVMKIPRTIPRGGWIEESCGKCWNRARQEEARRVYRAVAGFIGSGLAGSRGVFGEETHAAMVGRAREFADGLVEDCIGEPRGQWWQ